MKSNSISYFNESRIWLCKWSSLFVLLQQYFILHFKKNKHFTISFLTTLILYISCLNINSKSVTIIYLEYK